MPYGGFGGSYPVRYGGGPSRPEAALAAYRDALGGADARVLGPETGIEAAWMRAVAIGLAANESTQEAAAKQAFPQTATHHVDAWAGRLGLDPEPTPQEQRAANVARVLEKVRADIPSLEAELAKLSPYLSLYSPEHEAHKVVQFGMAFSDDASIFTAGSTQYPGYSTYYRMIIVWDHVASGEAGPDIDLRRRVEKFLNEHLPGWVDYTIQQAPGTVFYLDGGADGTSLLDITPLGA